MREKIQKDSKKIPKKNVKPYKNAFADQMKQEV